MKQNLLGFLKIFGICFAFFLLFVSFLSAFLLPYVMYKDPEADILLIFTYIVLVGFLLQIGTTAEYLYRSRKIKGNPNRFRRNKYWRSKNKFTNNLLEIKRALAEREFINIEVTTCSVTASHPIVFLGVPTKHKPVDFIRPRIVTFDLTNDNMLLLKIEISKRIELFDFTMSSLYLFNKLNSHSFFKELEFVPLDSPELKASKARKSKL